MEITEITSKKDALDWIGEATKNSDNTYEVDMVMLGDKVPEWSNEFDTLQREIKQRENQNHHKLNRIIGLYFLIPASNEVVSAYKKSMSEADYA